MSTHEADVVVVNAARVMLSDLGVDVGSFMP
jgi:hypothetical protein